MSDNSIAKKIERMIVGHFAFSVDGKTSAEDHQMAKTVSQFGKIYQYSLHKKSIKQPAVPTPREVLGADAILACAQWLATQSRDDVVVWCERPEETFSVDDVGYMKLLDNWEQPGKIPDELKAQHSEIHEVWKVIWKLHTMPRIEFQAWVRG